MIASTLETQGSRPMARILFYSPFNQRSRDTESLMLAFHRQGHTVTSLTQQEGFQINSFLTENGVTAISHIVSGQRGGWRYFLRHLFFFVRFCNKNKIDVVYSHLEPANFVASVGQYLIRAKTYLCRHHVDEGNLYHFDKHLYYRLTYRLARHVIVVSDRARRYMLEHEKIPARKILHINLAHDFGLYAKADTARSAEIRRSHNAEVLLLAACRFTEYKRPDLAIQVIKSLVDNGVDAKLILLGRGEMQERLDGLIKTLELEKNVFMPGYVNNILDYMVASDFFLHPSILESSCVTLKEAGLASLPSIVCRGVGDFDEYLFHKRNAFLLNAENFVAESAQVIQEFRNQKPALQRIGNKLNESIRSTFSVEAALSKYDQINNDI